MSKKLFTILGLLVLASMVLAACGTNATPAVVKETQVVTVKETAVVKETSVVTVKETQIVQVEITSTPAPTEAPKVTRKGAWVDNVVFTSIDQADQAVAQLQAGDIDIYAYTVADPEVFKTVQADPALQYSTALGSYNELTFNPSVFTDTTRLNPFAVPAVREAMNWLIDRDNVVQNIYGGLAVPKVLPLNSSFADYTRYVDVAREIEAYYAYNPDKAKEVISAEMEKLGATLGGDGKWMYQDNPVTVIMIIRTEDARRQIGDYVANQLESIGFTVDRQYKTRSEASPIWNRSNPVDGLWHIYTGGWITTAISRDDGTNFAYYYTNLGSGSPLWQAYVNTPEYYDVAEKLWNNEFASMDERAELFKTAMRLCMQDSVRVWVIDQISFAPYSSNVSVAYDLAGGISGTQLWPFTVKKGDTEGGTVRIAQPGILVEPWNPVAGSNWIYDTMPRRATEDYGTIADPYTGLAWPQRIEKAEITVKTGLPVAKTLDWVTLTTADTIEVPADAWVDWDAANQKFLTASEVYTAGLPTANTKRVVYYPSSLWETKWHDGSNLSMGDFVMGMILSFDRAKTDSAIYDESAVPAFESFMSVFKGVKIISTDPLVIETYSDAYALDAELMVSDWYPVYSQGIGAWHNLSLGIRAESEKLLTFSADKADALKTENEKIEWMSFITGPSLDILASELVSATAESYLPYAPTMGDYVTADEIALRYKNLGRWYAEQGHFWVGTGPFYLNKAFPVEQTLSLARYSEYPDMADKWGGFGTPKIATAEVDGPGEVTIGSEAKFSVYINFGDAPYPNADIDGVKYLVFDATGALVATGVGTATEEGVFEIVLSTDVTSKLVAGSNKIEVAVTSKVVSIPSFATFEFVTK